MITFFCFFAFFCCFFWEGGTEGFIGCIYWLRRSIVRCDPRLFFMGASSPNRIDGGNERRKEEGSNKRPGIKKGKKKGKRFDSDEHHRQTHNRLGILLGCPRIDTGSFDTVTGMLGS